MDFTDSYKSRYKMRAVGSGGSSIITTLPPQAVQREASKHGLSVKEFIDQYRVVACYDDFGGVFFQYEKAEDKGSSKTSEHTQMAKVDIKREASSFNTLREKLSGNSPNHVKATVLKVKGRTQEVED